MPHLGDVGDIVCLPRQPLAGGPLLLLCLPREVPGSARQVVEDDVGLHDGQSAMTQCGHLAVAVHRQIVGLLLRAVFQVHRAEAERQPRQRQIQHRLVGRTRGETAEQREVFGNGGIGHLIAPASWMIASLSRRSPRRDNRQRCRPARFSIWKGCAASRRCRWCCCTSSQASCRTPRSTPGRRCAFCSTATPPSMCSS